MCTVRPQVARTQRDYDLSYCFAISVNDGGTVVTVDNHDDMESPSSLRKRVVQKARSASFNAYRWRAPS